MNQAYTTGKESEQLASHYLQQHGLILLEKNYHCRQGEIDLIMQDQQTLVFVEVRYRKSARYGSALESVDLAKQSRIITTAQNYLQQNKTKHSACRFDVIAISPTTTTPEITWITDAFQLN